MIVKANNPEAGRAVRMLALTLFVLLCLLMTGCKKEAEAPKEKTGPEATAPHPGTPEAAPPEGTHPAEAKPLTEAPTGKPTKLETMHPVTLTGVNITEDSVHNATRFQITATGDFVFNILPKTSPERIVVILHNTDRGKAPARIPVNNGTIKGVEISELNTGKGKAVSITISLSRKTKYISSSASGILVINVLKKV